MFSRGVELPELGSVEDRLMREMVYRERMEKIAHVRAFASIAARLMGSEADRAFGDVIAEYASEVFQESYDPIVLMRKRDRLREAQSRVRQRRVADMRSIERLERMDKLGEQFDVTSKKTIARKQPK